MAKNDVFESVRYIVALTDICNIYICSPYLFEIFKIFQTHNYGFIFYHEFQNDVLFVSRWNTYINLLKRFFILVSKCIPYRDRSGRNTRTAKSNGRSLLHCCGYNQ